MRKDAAVSGMETVEAVTPKIGGPSAAELRRPLSKSLDQIAAELRQEHLQIVRNMRGGK